MKKYRGSFAVGTLCVFLNNGIWILFPQSRAAGGRRSDAFTSEQHRRLQYRLLTYALLLLAVACAQRHLSVSDALDSHRHFPRN